jgi:hypothetical protein
LQVRVLPGPPLTPAICRHQAEAGFELAEFSFGIRDFFTHQIVVARKI